VEEIISHLAYESTELLNSPTAPYIRETVDEGRTILLDTLERHPKETWSVWSPLEGMCSE